ncbi:MAG: spermidine synthase [Desulfobacteraceae bacterium]|nr:MAG: spermidine synthase [Desulfobacteraceae bacterium]
MEKYRLEIIVFITGAVVMALELVGSRIVAPYLGASIYVWTSLIGVILASLSLGYYWGGRLADKKPDYRTFSLLILSSAIFTGIIGVIKIPVLDAVCRLIPDIRISAVMAAALLFAPASVLLGTISPYAIRLRMENLEHSGATVGRLYAISTVGSIIGTFAAGFFLISFLGSRNILILLSLILFAVYFLACFGNTSRSGKLIALFTAALLLSAHFFPASESDGKTIDIDTKYSRILIEEMTAAGIGKKIRLIRVDRNWAQGAVIIGEPDELFFSYSGFYRLADHFYPGNGNALLIGGGTYMLARDYIKRNPGNNMDVVEIDPDFTELSKKYFYLEDDPRITSIHEDGRTFLKRAAGRYDIMFIDVFKSSASPPFQMTTVEAIRSASNMMNEKGVLITNIYSAIQGEKGKFFRAAYATIKSVFPQVYVFPVQYPLYGDESQNVIIVALKSNDAPVLESSDPEMNGYLSHLWKYKIDCDLPVLTDEFAPVEHYLVEVIKDL